jgi:acyl-homoserine-lactone acylase
MRVLRLVLAAGLVLGFAVPAVPLVRPGRGSRRPELRPADQPGLRHVRPFRAEQRLSASRAGPAAPLGLDARTRRLVDGYVTGVNRQVAEVAELCHGAQWTRPVTAEDRTRMFGEWGGLHDFRLPIAEARPAASDAVAVPRPRSGEQGGNGGLPERMTEIDVTVPTGPGTGVTTKVYRSRYGPAPAQDDSVAELRKTQNRYQGVPFVNATAADLTGVVYFADAAAVPHGADEQAAGYIDAHEAKELCPTGPKLNGSTSDRMGGNDSDAAAPGIFGSSRYPTMTRADFVANGNGSSWLTNPAMPITARAPFYESIGTKRLPRTQPGRAQIQDRLGVDPTLADGRQLLTGERNRSAERTRDAAATMCPQDPLLMSGDVSAGRRPGGRRGAGRVDRARCRRRPGSVAVAGVLAPCGPAYGWLVGAVRPEPPGLAAEHSRHVEPRRAASACRRRASLGTVECPVHVPVDAPLSAARHTTVGGGEPPVPGCGNVERCYDITAATDSGLLRDDGRFGAVTMGSSFVMTGRLTRDGPMARTLLTSFQSSDPSSPHQTALYGRNGWAVDRFAEAEIAAGSDRSMSVLCGRGAWFTLRRESTS